MFEKVLVPVDFGQASIAALTYAVDLVKTLRGAGEDPSLELLHCYEIPAITGPDGSVLVGPEAATDISHSENKKLKEMVKRWCPADIVPKRVLLMGPAAETILARSKEIAADLIVIGTHGRRGLHRFFLGSVAEQVIRASSVPVLAIRPKPEQKS